MQRAPGSEDGHGVSGDNWVNLSGQFLRGTESDTVLIQPRDEKVKKFPGQRSS